MRKKKDKCGEPTFSKQFQNNAAKSKSHRSILQKHTARLEEFKNPESRIKGIDAKLKNIVKQVDKLKTERSYMRLNNESEGNTSYHIDRLETEMRDLERRKRTIMSGEDMTDYLLSSTRIITEYVALQAKESELLNMDTHNPAIAEELNLVSKQKDDLAEEYLTRFEQNYVPMQRMYYREDTACTECNQHFIVRGGFSVCPGCGKCIKVIDVNSNLSYKEMQDYDYKPQFTYDKMTHLEDWLRRFQAKENRVVPQDVLDRIIIEAKKERIKDLSLLTEDKVKRYLKKIELNEYYDNVIGIINRINGRPPFTLTLEIEKKIKLMFQQIQDPFEKYKPPNRKNFLSYSYCLHKFFQILGLHEFAKYFPLLKSADKLRQQDDIFKKIVAEMAETDTSINWVFYPSI